MIPLMLAMFALGQPASPSVSSPGPTYTAASIVGAADNQAGSLAPNTIASLYGTTLSYTIASLSEAPGNVLPTVLPGTGVRVLVGGLPANIYYVSPNQINFLVPSILLPGPSNLQVVLDGRAGPLVAVDLKAEAPALFQLDAQTAIATHADGSPVTSAAPGRPAEIVILYATGLGQTVPAVVYGQLPTTAALLRQFASFQITLDGTPLDADNILYAGIAPFNAGLYQINLRIPGSTGAYPQIQVGFPDQLSIAGLTLIVQP